MNEDYLIPANGEIPYQFIEIETKLTEDKWVQAFEVKAGDPKAVHHVIMYARPPSTLPARPAALAAGRRRAGLPPAPRRRPRCSTSRRTWTFPPASSADRSNT